MRLLAIDTSLTACAAAVFDVDRGVLASETQSMARGHAEALIPLIERVMAAARISFDALDRIAVTVGPGSFTGLRVGVSAARGIALAAQRPAVGVTTLDAFAAPWLARNDRMPILVAIDARNDQGYMQAFGADNMALSRPRLAPLQEAFNDIPSGPLRVTGSAARRVAAIWPADRSIVADDKPAPDIEWVARLGVSADAGAAPKPLYLRGPGARPQDAARLARR
jgi:tRNA threonylcarbamoyladenosine biosynthesis protein TsaB